MNKLLFVDDEKQILKSLKRMLMDTDYDLYTAGSGQEALEILEEEPEMDLIISDMRMPIMDGFQLLSEVKKRFPHVVRVILSGYTDEKIIFKALQENIAKLYMLKPWNSEIMLREIEHVFETERILGSPNIACIVNNGPPVATINTGYEEIMELITNGADIDEIVEYIEKDMVIAANVLRIANSAFFNANTGSVRQALMHIGKNGLHTFLLTASVVDCICLDDENMAFIEKIWEHAFLANRIFTFIYDECLGKSVPEISSSAGLLHKIGITLLLHCKEDEYVKILQMANEGKVDIFEKEMELFGATHAQVGAYLLEGWDFPYPIIEAALYYSTPFDSQIINNEVLSAVHIAQYYAGKLSGVANFFPLCEKTFDELKLKKERFEKRLYEISWMDKE